VNKESTASKAQVNHSKIGMTATIEKTMPTSNRRGFLRDKSRFSAILHEKPTASRLCRRRNACINCQ
jgi:hypothetical protein